MSITLKASVNIRAKRGARFPPGSYKAVLEQARPSLQHDVERAFTEKRDPVTGRSWPPRKNFYPWPMLVKTGLMEARAVTAAGNAIINGNTLFFSVRLPKYAKFQNARRRFIGVSATTLAIVRRALAAEGKAQTLRILRGQ